MVESSPPALSAQLGRGQPGSDLSFPGAFSVSGQLLYFPWDFQLLLASIFQLERS